MLLLLSADFSKLTFSKNSLRNTFRVSNSLDPDQERHSVSRTFLDQGPHFLQRSLADDKCCCQQGKSFICLFALMLYVLVNNFYIKAE